MCKSECRDNKLQAVDLFLSIYLLGYLVLSLKTMNESTNGFTMKDMGREEISSGIKHVVSLKCQQMVKKSLEIACKFSKTSNNRRWYQCYESAPNMCINPNVLCLPSHHLQRLVGIFLILFTDECRESIHCVNETKLVLLTT